MAPGRGSEPLGRHLPCPQVQQDLLLVYSLLTGFSHLRVINHHSSLTTGPLPYPQLRKSVGTKGKAQLCTVRPWGQAGTSHGIHLMLGTSLWPLPTTSSSSGAQSSPRTAPRPKAELLLSSEQANWVCVWSLRDCSKRQHIRVGCSHRRDCAKGIARAATSMERQLFPQVLASTRESRSCGSWEVSHLITPPCQKLFPLPAVSVPSWDSYCLSLSPRSIGAVLTGADKQLHNL